jgi:hypothetical protein
MDSLTRLYVFFMSKKLMKNRPEEFWPLRFRGHFGSYFLSFPFFCGKDFWSLMNSNNICFCFLGGEGVWGVVPLHRPLLCPCRWQNHSRPFFILVRREIIVRGQSYFSRLPKYWPPIPLSARRVCIPAFVAGGRTDSPGGEGDGGSTFWKTREIGLPSYNDLSTSSYLCQSL